jgi:hypothetical protein
MCTLNKPSSGEMMWEQRPREGEGRVADGKISKCKVQEKE